MLIIKKHLYAIAVACLFVAFPNTTHAQTDERDVDPFDEQANLPAQIRVQVEYIDVSHEQLTELLFGEKPPANDVELRKQVGQLVKDGKASIMETMLCIARSGNKAATQSIEELIYPTEYEPAQLQDKTPTEEKGETQKPSVTRGDSAIGPSPVAFETRNVGSTLEIEPILSQDQKMIALTLAPEIIYHVGYEVWAEWKGKYGNSPIKMPKFYTLRVNTSVALADGEPMLIAALSPKDQDGKVDFTRKLMVFVRADVITSGR